MDIRMLKVLLFFGLLFIDQLCGAIRKTQTKIEKGTDIITYFMVFYAKLLTNYYLIRVAFWLYGFGW